MHLQQFLDATFDPKQPLQRKLINFNRKDAKSSLDCDKSTDYLQTAQNRFTGKMRLPVHNYSTSRHQVAVQSTNFELDYNFGFE